MSQEHCDLLLKRRLSRWIAPPARAKVTVPLLVPETTAMLRVVCRSRGVETEKQQTRLGLKCPNAADDWRIKAERMAKAAVLPLDILIPILVAGLPN